MNTQLFYAFTSKLNTANDKLKKAKKDGDIELIIEAETELKTWTEARNLLYLCGK